MLLNGETGVAVPGTWVGVGTDGLEDGNKGSSRQVPHVTGQAVVALVPSVDSLSHRRVVLTATHTQSLSCTDRQVRSSVHVIVGVDVDTTGGSIDDGTGVAITGLVVLVVETVVVIVVVDVFVDRVMGGGAPDASGVEVEAGVEVEGINVELDQTNFLSIPHPVPWVHFCSSSFRVHSLAPSESHSLKAPCHVSASLQPPNPGPSDSDHVCLPPGSQNLLAQPSFSVSEQHLTDRFSVSGAQYPSCSRR